MLADDSDDADEADEASVVGVRVDAETLGVRDTERVGGDIAGRAAVCGRELKLLSGRASVV